jgi:hypothetical protein
LEVFGRRPPAHPVLLSRGRHPKTFTIGDIVTLADEFGCCSAWGGFELEIHSAAVAVGCAREASGLPP